MLSDHSSSQFLARYARVQYLRHHTVTADDPITSLSKSSVRYLTALVMDFMMILADQQLGHMVVLWKDYGVFLFERQIRTMSASSNPENAAFA